MLDEIESRGLDLGRSVLDADRGYDSDGNCGRVFGMGMIPVEIPPQMLIKLPHGYESHLSRYETVTRPSRKERDFVEICQKTYLKYHITAILGLQIVLGSAITPSNVNDSPMLPKMLDEIESRGLDLGRSVLDADRGYDSDGNCGRVFGMGMIPNIRQRKDAVNRGKPYRRKAAAIFDELEYKKRNMIEGIFGERRPNATSCTAGSSRSPTAAGSARSGQSLGTSRSSTAFGAPMSVESRYRCTAEKTSAASVPRIRKTRPAASASFRDQSFRIASRSAARQSCLLPPGACMAVRRSRRVQTHRR